jgi:hypothetical protein
MPSPERNLRQVVIRQEADSNHQSFNHYFSDKHDVTEGEGRWAMSCSSSLRVFRPDVSDFNFGQKFRLTVAIG